MANEPIIGGAKVRITADTTGLKAGIDESRGAIDKAAGSTERLQSLLSKLFVPAAMATAVAGLLNRFIQINREVEQVGENMDAVSDKAVSMTRQLGLAGREMSERAQRVAEAQAKAIAQQQEINRLAQEELEKRDSIWGAVSRVLVSGESRADIEKRALEQQERISAQLAEQVRLIDLQVERETQAANEAERRKKAKEEEALLNERLKEQQQAITDLALRQAETEEERIRIRADAEARAIEERIKQLGAEGGPLASTIQSILRGTIDAVTKDMERQLAEVEKRQHQERLNNIRRENEERIKGLREEMEMRERMRFGDSNQSFINAGIAGRPSILPRQGGVFEGRVD